MVTALAGNKADLEEKRKVSTEARSFAQYSLESIFIFSKECRIDSLSSEIYYISLPSNFKIFFYHFFDLS